MKKATYGYYIGKATDDDIQYKGSSGGIGSIITKYLLDNKKFDSALSFRFNKKECKYEPIIVHKSEDINICGSIYQDIDIPKFIKEHISEIEDGIVVSCTPCQVGLVKHILKAKGKNAFTISFCCSGQTTIEGTWKYYQLLGIEKENVVRMQYRGNGWPSGIQIWLKDGSKIYKGNYTDPWKTLHRSLLYRPKRCFTCKLDTSYQSDISIADPWLDTYKENDNRGHSLFLINTEKGYNVIKTMSDDKIIEKEDVDFDTYCKAQKINIIKETQTKRYKRAYKIIVRLRDNSLYFKLASLNTFMMRMCIRINRLIQKIIRY